LITRVSSLKNLLGKISPVEESDPDKQILEKIADRLDRLERRTMTMISPQPPTWAAITNKETHRKKKTPQQPPIPTNTEINKFKKASVVIRTPPGFVALDSILAPKITSKIKHTLKSINATVDSQITEIAGIAWLPSKDLKIFTATRPQAQWLLANKHIWTELVCAKLKTLPTRFPVILHALPTHFDPANPTHLQELGRQNWIEPSLIQSAWSQSKKEKKGSLVLHLLNKDIALKIEKTRLFLQKKLYRGAHYTQSIPQCYQCWKIGYTAHWCKNSPLCKQCTGNHDSTACTTPTTTSIKCCICITQEKTASKTPVNTLEERYTHPPWSEACPQLK
jgi:hypothetical protein